MPAVQFYIETVLLFEDLPLVDLTKDSRNEVYVDLTGELPISPEPTADGVSIAALLT